MKLPQQICGLLSGTSLFLLFFFKPQNYVLKVAGAPVEIHSRRLPGRRDSSEGTASSLPFVAMPQKKNFEDGLLYVLRNLVRDHHSVGDHGRDALEVSLVQV